MAELRAERETTRAALAELRAANEQLRARVLELERELAKLKRGGPRGMPGLKSEGPAAGAEAKPRKGNNVLDSSKSWVPNTNRV